ncbi:MULTISPECIES: ABC transporter ATP-binding protein [Bacillus]|uniref:Multidrug ABC transporter ATP-binding protein n=2 Tax=Bacillus TaxID=1386 RepID=A0A0M4FNV6_9BACI|nr:MULTISPECIES: ABC transporter ATP-binding protein [Bacillus]ALC80384.1 multidrug ABC transporter ATP-binding protein [Bacillus gobiensis]MBP1083766.1 ATP-binding cassette subfamily B protein [Bacillus capparidis]MED1098251.1 ABC transporter ATP-binding protein [Bacillus capparidis]
MSRQITDPFRYKKLDRNKKDQSVKRASKAKDWQGTLKRIWSYLAKERTKLFLVFSMVILSSALSLLGPFLIGVTIDEYIVKNKTNGLLLILAALFVIYIIYSASLWLQNYWMINISQKTVYTVRNELFSRLHQLPISFFDKRQHGELMSRVTNDMENVSSTLNSSAIQVLSSVLTLIGTIAVMLYLSPLLTLLTMTIIPLMAIGMKWITNRTGELFKEQQKNLGELNGYIEETINGQRIVKTFSQEERVVTSFLEKSERLKTSGFWAQTISGFIPKVMNMLNNLSFTIIAGIGGIFALNGAISIGEIVIFAEYSRQFTRPLNDLANQFNTLLSAIAGAERVFDIIDEREETEDEESAGHHTINKGKVEFKDVAFSYEKGEKTVSGLTFTIQPGETIAFVGPTGAGKTTVTNLLARFYEPDSGHIYIDGHDSRQITRESLRKHMGFVLQDSFLFQGTILENIRYGWLDASKEEVIEAAKHANAHAFIEKLPNKYQTKLNQNGGGISQGQKQLISIARALLADPVLLILDEATSSIDTVTELKIQEALGYLMKGRTSVVIAHRLNTIQNADQIIVLEDGRITEKGTHNELIKQKGFYFGLYQSQFNKNIG